MRVDQAVAARQARRDAGVGELDERGAGHRQAGRIRDLQRGPAGLEAIAQRGARDGAGQRGDAVEGRHRHRAAQARHQGQRGGDRRAVRGHRGFAREHQERPVAVGAAHLVAGHRGVVGMEELVARAGRRHHRERARAGRVVHGHAVALGGHGEHPVRLRGDRGFERVLVAHLARVEQFRHLGGRPAGIGFRGGQVVGRGKIGQVIGARLDHRAHGRHGGRAVDVLLPRCEAGRHQQRIRREALGLGDRLVGGREQHVVAAPRLAGRVHGLQRGHRGGERGRAGHVDDVPGAPHAARWRGEAAGGGGGLVASVLLQGGIDGRPRARRHFRHLADRREERRALLAARAVHRCRGNVGGDDGFDGALARVARAVGRTQGGVEPVGAERLGNPGRELRRRAGAVRGGDLCAAIGPGRDGPGPHVAGREQQRHGEQAVAVGGAAHAQLDGLAVGQIRVRQVQHGHLALLRGEVGHQQHVAELVGGGLQGDRIRRAQLAARRGAAGAGHHAGQGGRGESAAAEQ